MRVLVVLGAAAGLAALVVGTTVAQGRADAREARPLPGLPAWTAGYRSWTRINRRPIPPRAGGDAHRGTKNVYASRRIQRGRYPYGTVIVKEVRRGGFVAVVAAMRKRRGFSARHNDWQMVEWVRSTPSGRFGVLAQGQICYGCHVGARANDYVFTRR
jgi:hypothetical protein